MKKIILIGLLLVAGVSHAEPSSRVWRIIGGHEIIPHSYPWMAALINLKSQTAYCAASLIHPHWLVTAAHCVKDMNPEQIEAVLNIHNLKNDVGDKVMAKRIILHPRYDYSRNDDYDIALIELESDMPYRTIGWISDDRNLIGTDSLAIGWGSTGDHYSEVLMEISIPIISNSICNDSYNSSGIYGQNPITERMLCAGSDGKDSCAGDSGGPLMIRVGDSWKLAGIVSWGGKTCAQKGLYGIYTKVSAFTEFINSYVPAVLEAPQVSLTVLGTRVTYSWTSVPQAEGYLLSYAPYPDVSYIRTADMGEKTSLSLDLWKGAAYYVAIQAYTGSGTSPYSRIDFFVIPQ